MHIQRFVDRLRGFEARGAKDFIMSMSDAKDLHADITRLLLDLHTRHENTPNTSDQDQVISVEIGGGTFR
jgi:hypothetical protein